MNLVESSNVVSPPKDSSERFLLSSSRSRSPSSSKPFPALSEWAENGTWFVMRRGVGSRSCGGGKAARVERSCLKSSKSPWLV